MGEHQDLTSRYGDPAMVEQALAVLEAEDQTEEEFLGAQGVLMINRML